MSLLRQTYYHLKPYLPQPLRMTARRYLASRILAKSGNVWPIRDGSQTRPANWPGWPEAKKFAVVLTHDVESCRGLDRCLRLAALEESFGFRSSFNFIPEGDYTVPEALRTDLVSRGFEIGVHDLHHDGKLYRSRETFRQHSRKINNYLKSWNAVGFRSGFMHHNLEWLHDLDIAYDMSTFDTDPLEPQPDPQATIFPFWVENAGRNKCYLELPYTLPQDSTLFLVLREPNIEIWRRKLDWIAEHGGMVLVNTHPDYMCDKTEVNSTHKYPTTRYSELLAYINHRYQGQFWHALPRELAAHMKENGRNLPARRSTERGKIWIDLDNTPHVPFFAPIIRKLESRGFPVVVTSRRAFQVCELADETGLKHTCIGHHYGKNPVAKVLGLFVRALQFLPFVLNQKPALAVSHGARSQILICNLLRIPTVLLADYEHAKILPFLRPTWLFVPEVIPIDGLAESATHVGHYPGIKEDVYVPSFNPSAELTRTLKLDPEKTIVTVRPPATEAHYRSPESDRLFEATMEHLTSRGDVQVVLLPRNRAQLQEIQLSRPEWFEGMRTIVPEGAVDGLNLLWHSDLVVSGGGTMNREAAALGIPVYSIFRGKAGAVDLHLQREGRLLLLETPEDVRQKIVVQRRVKEGKTVQIEGASDSLDFIVNRIEALLQRD